MILNVCVFQERIDGIVQACEAFVQSGHFDADNIKSKAEQVLERYQQLSVSSCVENIVKDLLLIINIININTRLCSPLKVIVV